MAIAKGSELPLLCAVCLLISLVLGLPLIAQTTSESDTRESADAGDKTLQVSDASGNHYGKEAPQTILIDSKPDFLDTFLATRKGKRIVGALSVVIGMIFLFTRRIVTRSNKHFLKNEGILKEYEAVIQRDTFLLLGFVALMLGSVYLVWSIFSVQ